MTSKYEIISIATLEAALGLTLTGLTYTLDGVTTRMFTDSTIEEWISSAERTVFGYIGVTYTLSSVPDLVYEYIMILAKQIAINNLINKGKIKDQNPLEIMPYFNTIKENLNGEMYDTSIQSVKTANRHRTRRSRASMYYDYN